MEERDSVRTLLYILARLGLFWLINIFATIIGKTAILGIVGTLVPRIALYDNPELLSFFSWLIPAGLLIWLFVDDSKRHTAYGLYSAVTVELAMLITAILYYIPALCLNYAEDRKVVGAIENLYFTSFWFSKINEDPQIYALIGIAAQVLLCVLSYMIAHRIYLKKFAED